MLTLADFAKQAPRHLDALRAQARRRWSKDEAEDIVQETYLRALSALDTFGGATADLEAWLFELLRKTSVRAHFDKRKHPLPATEHDNARFLATPAPASEPPPSEEASPVMAAHLARLASTLELLPPEFSAVIAKATVISKATTPAYRRRASLRLLLQRRLLAYARGAPPLPLKRRLRISKHVATMWTSCDTKSETALRLRLPGDVWLTLRRPARRRMRGQASWALNVRLPQLAIPDQVLDDDLTLAKMSAAKLALLELQAHLQQVQAAIDFLTKSPSPSPSTRRDGR